MGAGQIPERIGQTVSTTHLTASRLDDAGRVAGIVVALPEELATLTRQKLKQGECIRFGNHWLAYAGAGFDNASNASRLLLDQGANYLVSWGCAAGLSEDVQPGDLVLASEVLTDSQRFAADPAWKSALERSLPTGVSLHSGNLYSTNKLVSQSRDKQRIHGQTQAIALDMESAAVAETASRADAAFAVVRCIADPAGMDLPGAISHALTPQGQVRIGKLLRYLLTHPWEISALLRLARHFKAAQNTLLTVSKTLFAATAD